MADPSADTHAACCKRLPNRIDLLCWAGQELCGEGFGDEETLGHTADKAIREYRWGDAGAHGVDLRHRASKIQVWPA